MAVQDEELVVVQLAVRRAGGLGAILDGLRGLRLLFEPAKPISELEAQQLAAELAQTIEHFGDDAPVKRELAAAVRTPE